MKNLIVGKRQNQEITRKMKQETDRHGRQEEKGGKIKDSVLTQYPLSDLQIRGKKMVGRNYQISISRSCPKLKEMSFQIQAQKVNI